MELTVNVTGEKLAGLAAKSPIAVFLHGSPVTIPSWTKDLPETLQSAIKTRCDAGDFTGKEGSTTPVFASDGTRAVLIGIGARRRLDLEAVRRAYGTAVQAARGCSFGSLVAPVVPGADVTAITENAVAAAMMGNYLYDECISDKSGLTPQLKALTLWEPDGKRRRRVANAIDNGRVLGEATCRVRDLTNKPANDLYPKSYATLAGKFCRDAGVKLQVLGLSEIKKAGMGAVLAVGGGSKNEPQFLIMQYNGRRGKTKAVDVALVGKGVTFDSGGISIKPSADMWEMRGDMMGSAVVISTICAAAKMKLPVNLVAVAPLVENMPSGTAYRPGDVVRTMSGLTVEIMSTDAEGRMILADGLHYVQRYDPKLIIDCATLTGAMAIALGDVYAGYFSNTEPSAKKLEKAAAASGERVWRMPLHPDYDEKFKSPVADMRNGGGRYGGASIAARILQRFVGDYPWMHIDIAGIDLLKSGNSYTPKGASGFGARLLIEFLRQK
ncbi:MAG: leucyl aminopeptidase [Candidatus Zixiibacteriota bacterium]